LGRLLRAIVRKVELPTDELMTLLATAHVTQAQQRYDKSAISSDHKPRLECFAQGKPKMKCVFSDKVSIALNTHGRFAYNRTKAVLLPFPRGPTQSFENRSMLK
jgi:hypothetical protein